MLPPASYQLNICSDTRKSNCEFYNSSSLEVIIWGASLKANGAKPTFKAVHQLWI